MDSRPETSHSSVPLQKDMCNPQVRWPSRQPHRTSTLYKYIGDGYPKPSFFESHLLNDIGRQECLQSRVVAWLRFPLLEQVSLLLSWLGEGSSVGFKAWELSMSVSSMALSSLTLRRKAFNLYFERIPKRCIILEMYDCSRWLQVDGLAKEKERVFNRRCAAFLAGFFLSSCSLLYTYNRNPWRYRGRFWW